MSKKKQAETTSIRLEDVLTKTEAAVEMGISVETFNKRKRNGKIPEELIVKRHGRDFGYDKNKLREWLDSQE